MNETQSLDAVDMQGIEAFTFGDPIPVMEQWQTLYWGECHNHQLWYAPPYDPDALSKTMRASPHHSSAIFVKRNILASTFIPHKLLSHRDFSKMALDYLTFGNAYIERVPARSKKTMKLKFVVLTDCNSNPAIILSLLFSKIII